MNIPRDKIEGCWLGKGLGGTLGMPYEGCSGPLSASFDNMPASLLPNDDLDLQLLWLHVLEQKGTGTRSVDLARAAADHYVCYPDEYGVARWNTWRGFLPPVTGKHNNAFGDGMGAAIRSEIWACLAPGRPVLAAALAKEDALVDHFGDGVHAEMFLASLESACFVTSNLRLAIDTGLSIIPVESRLARALHRVCQWHGKGYSWEQARKCAVESFGSHNFTDVTINLSFILLGLLYGGGDFERSVTLAVNGGLDTDCTGATCGSIMGILLGASGLPGRLRSAAGHAVAFHESLGSLPLPQTLHELTDRTLQLQIQWENEPDAPLENATPEQAQWPQDSNDWLVFRYAAEEVLSGEPAAVGEAERAPLQAQDRHRRFHGIHLDVGDLVQRPGDVLYLLTWLTAAPPTPGNVFLMACAGAGITAWWDGALVLNYHGRNPALPAFHRTEGGATVPVPLTCGRAHLLKIRLICGSVPLICTAALGDHMGRFLHPLRYSSTGCD